MTYQPDVKGPLSEGVTSVKRRRKRTHSICRGTSLTGSSLTGFPGGNLPVVPYALCLPRAIDKSRSAVIKLPGLLGGGRGSLRRAPERRQAGTSNQEKMPNLEGTLIRSRDWRTPSHKSALSRTRELPHQQTRSFLVRLPSYGPHL
jgi:hypothetical protein